MGWTFTVKNEDESERDFFAREFQSCNMIDFSKHGSECYMVLEPKRMLGQRFAMVCMTQRDNSSSCNFGYKDISEEMGPFAYNCPERLLNQLTPTDSVSANEWRQACRDAAVARKSAASKRKQASVGTTITLARVVKFNDGHSHDKFVVRQYRNGKAYESTANGRLYKITGLAQIGFTVS